MNGEVGFNLANLALTDLEEKLGQLTGTEALGEAASLKWMLCGKHSFLPASFLVFGQRIEPYDVPSTFTLHGPESNLKCAGVGPGDFQKQERAFLPR